MAGAAQDRRILIGGPEDCNNIPFNELLGWLPVQEDQHGLQIVGYLNVAIQNGRHIVGADNGNTWRNEYDFARTAHSAIRQYMLHASNLHLLYNPGYSTRRENLRNIEYRKIPNLNPNVNEGQRLARNTNQAEQVAVNFDRLYPIHWIRNCAENLNVGDEVHKTMNMVVIDEHHQTVWWFIATLSITRENAEGERQRKSFLVIPNVNAYRYEYANRVATMGISGLGDGFDGCHKGGDDDGDDDGNSRGDNRGKHDYVEVNVANATEQLMKLAIGK